MQMQASRRRSLSDPLALALLPPPNESPDDRARRLHAEHEARLVSEAIDEQIKQEKAALRRRKQEIKILLLGQSESGPCPCPLHASSRTLCPSLSPRKQTPADHHPSQANPPP